MSVAFVLPLILQTTQPMTAGDGQQVSEFDRAFDQTMSGAVRATSPAKADVAELERESFNAAFAPWASRPGLAGSGYLGLQSAQPAERQRPDRASTEETEPESEELPPEFEVEPSEPPPVDNESIDGRRRPGFTGELPDRIDQTNEGAFRAPPPEAFPMDQLPVPDRWRLIESLGIVKEKLVGPLQPEHL